MLGSWGNCSVNKMLVINYKDLSLIPIIYIKRKKKKEKKPGVVTQASNPNAGKATKYVQIPGTHSLASHHSLVGQPRTMRDPVWKTKKILPKEQQPS